MELEGSEEQKGADDNKKPIDFFRIFLNDNILQDIAGKTNKYAKIKIEEMENANKLPDYLSKWQDVTKEDVLLLIAILFYMGIVQLPEIKFYWSKNRFFPDTIIPNLISKTRFHMITKFLKIRDITEENPSDKIRKVRPLLNNLMYLWRRMYYPNQQICIDEKMIRWTGKLSFKQYVQGKPNPYGIKSYLLCDSKTGYVYNMELYCGKQSNSEANTINSTVLRLCKGLELKGHKLYMDNFYTSPLLFDSLATQMIGCSGTLKKNRRNIPKKIKNLGKMHKGFVEVYKRGTLLAFVWKDKKPVRFLTNITGGLSLVSKKTKTGVEQIYKPTSIVEYNQYKSGVDLSDQYESY